MYIKNLLEQKYGTNLVESGLSVTTSRSFSGKMRIVAEEVTKAQYQSR